MRRITDLFLHDLPGSLPADHSRNWIPAGYLGTAATIARMREFVTEYKRNFEIRKLAAKIIANCPAKDYHCYAKALYEFCRDRIKYAYDPHMVELVESPTKVLEAGIADCDSVCTLLASLNESIGLKTRFRTVKADAKRPDDFSHVYCVVRVPQSRFSSSAVNGWIPEDATLPDKIFGWEPKGMLGHKDWAASKDKDGEDEDGIGGVSEMNPRRMQGPQNETAAQLEINQLTNALNQRLVGVLRKGLEYSDPNKAQVIMVGVSKVAGQAVLPIAPSQKLGTVRNGYAYWSDVIDQTSGSMPDLVGSPMMGGYASMGEGADQMGGIWDTLFGGPTTKVMTTQETAKSRIDAYVAQIGDRVSRLSAGGANAYYPNEMGSLGNMLSYLQNIQVGGNPDMVVREENALGIYKPAVALANQLAEQMAAKGKRVDQPESLQTMKADEPVGITGTAQQILSNIFGTSTDKLAPVYQQPTVADAAKSQLTSAYNPPVSPYTPATIPGTDEPLISPSTSDWLSKNGIWLGLGAVALVGAYLYFKKKQPAVVPAALNPRRRRKNPHVPFNVYLGGKLIDTVFYSDPRTTTDEVKRSLINHDGYDSRIRVVKRKRK